MHGPGHWAFTGGCNLCFSIEHKVRWEQGNISVVSSFLTNVSIASILNLIRFYYAQACLPQIFRWTTGWGGKSYLLIKRTWFLLKGLWVALSNINHLLYIRFRLMALTPTRIWWTLETATTVCLFLAKQSGSKNMNGSQGWTLRLQSKVRFVFHEAIGTEWTLWKNQFNINPNDLDSRLEAWKLSGILQGSPREIPVCRTGSLRSCCQDPLFWCQHWSDWYGGSDRYPWSHRQIVGELAIDPVCRLSQDKEVMDMLIFCCLFYT